MWPNVRKHWLVKHFFYGFGLVSKPIRTLYGATNSFMVTQFLCNIACMASPLQIELVSILILFKCLIYVYLNTLHVHAVLLLFLSMLNVPQLMSQAKEFDVRNLPLSADGSITHAVLVVAIFCAFLAPLAFVSMLLTYGCLWSSKVDNIVSFRSSSDLMVLQNYELLDYMWYSNIC